MCNFFPVKKALLGVILIEESFCAWLQDSIKVLERIMIPRFLMKNRHGPGSFIYN